ncbi:MAG TPA: hypothetical protein VJH20_00105 [Candidatus Nanoarchaeia archaeon]|nr:hypothetical protein [Candidatus Nanoarchaeia archaeon]
MSVETIKQNAEVLNEAIVNFNSYLLELESLRKSKLNSKDKGTKKLLEEQISRLNIKITDMGNYISKIQISIQKLIDEELNNNVT